MNVRTRFAPSPTGKLHIGGVRTALFAWLVARQHDGDFILRIEDTDRARYEEGAEQQIIDSLNWIGIDIDESPVNPGKYGPYRQSERLDLYTKYAQKLVDEGRAYADPSSPEQLQEWRDAAKAEKRPFHFNDHRPQDPPAWQPGMTLRLKIDTKRSPDWQDAIRGKQQGSTENIDDFILMKSDGYPTYNFAHIIDDHEMGITHVIRGDEFISSMPKFLILHDALGFDWPTFAHVPPILAPTGNKKLSKRDGAVDVLEYRDKGYPPAAVMNFLVLIGWNDGTETEIYTTEELIDAFELTRVQKSSARFDPDRLNWISGHHIRSMELEELHGRVSPFWPQAAATSDEDNKKQILSLVHERLKFYTELPELTSFFFTAPEITIKQIFEQDKQLRKKLDHETATNFLSKTVESLQNIEFNEDQLESTLRELVEKLDTKAGLLFKLIRWGITGSIFAPGLFETLATLGKDESLRRLEAVQ